MLSLIRATMVMVSHCSNRTLTMTDVGTREQGIVVIGLWDFGLEKQLNTLSRGLLVVSWKMMVLRTM